MEAQRKYHVIYSLSPAPNKKDHYRLIEIFERKEDAEIVLSALEKVNVLFHCYKIVEEHGEDIEFQKEVDRKP